MLMKLSAMQSSVRRTDGFTIIEVVLVAAVLMILMAMGIRSMFVFSEQRKLRTAAVELAGFLQVARDVASTKNSPCTINLTAANGGIFTHAPSSNCELGSMPPSVGLGGHTGSRDLQVTVIRGSYPLVFSPEGTVVQGATVQLSSQNVPDGAWCVDVLQPLATIRLGWSPSNQACNYAIEG